MNLQLSAPPIRPLRVIDAERLTRKELVAMHASGFDVVAEMVRRGLLKAH